MKKLYFAFAALAGALAGCMSMDDMLASDNKIWREMGESRAVTYATETGGEQTLEQRLAVIPKIRDQQKLAKIYIAPGALPEVKKAAREKLTEVDAFIYVVLNGTDQAQRKDAMKQCAGTDANRIAAAWRFALERPSSTITGSLLKGVKNPTLIAEAVAARIDEMTALSEDIETMRRNYGDGSFVEAKQKQLLALIGGVQKFAPYVQDEERLAAWIARADIAETRGTEIDLYTPFNEALAPLRIRKNILALEDWRKEKLLRGDSVKLEGGEEVALDAAKDAVVCGKAAVSRAEFEASITDKTILERIAAEKAAAEARKARRGKLAQLAGKLRKLPEEKRAQMLAKLEGEDDRLVLAWELAATAGGDNAAKAIAGEIAGGFDGTKVAKFLRGEIDEALKSGGDAKATLAAVETLAPFAKDELILTPLCERLNKAGRPDLARPLKTVADQARLAALGDRDIRRLLNGETIIKEDKYSIKMNSAGLGENGISPTRGQLIAALKDEAFRNRLLKEDELYRNAAAALGFGKAERLATKIRLSLEDDGIVAPPDAETGRPDGWLKEFAMACYDIEKKDPAIWRKAVKSFDNDLEAKTFFVSMLIHETGLDDADNAEKAAANAAILASLPQKTLEDMFVAAAYYREGIDTTDFPYGFAHIVGLPAIAKAIKDKEIIKHLLFDYDGWARYRGDEGRRERAYHALVDNIGGDEDMIWRLYCNTAPTRCDVISIGYLTSLAQKLSEAKRKELTDAAFARAADVAKTNIVVKGYYLGMSLADFQLINAANGSPATGTYDDASSRKMTRIQFERHYYNTFLGIDTGNPISDIDKFGRDYCTVPDGVDVSDKVKGGAALRTEMNLEGYSSEGVWKWVDTYHKFQAEINDSEGTLVFRAPVTEGLINQRDIRQEQANAIIDMFAGTDDGDVDYYD